MLLTRGAVVALTGCADTRQPDPPPPDQRVARSVAPADQELRLAERTLRRIDDDLRDLKESGAPDTQVIADYTVYRDSVRAMVDTQRRVAAATEAGSSVAPEDRYDPRRPPRRDALAEADR